MALPRRSSPRRSQHGFALVEMIMAMGIGILIAAGVWTVYEERRAIARGTAAGNTVESLIAMAEDTYAHNIEYATENAIGTKTYISIGRVRVAANNELPPGVFMNGTVHENMWGGTWTMGSASSDGGTTRDLLSLTVNRVPRAECQVMLTKLAPFVYDTRVNGALIHLERDPSAPADAPRATLDFGQAMSRCNNVNNLNTLTFRKLKDLRLPDLRRIWPYPDTLTPEEQGLTPSDRYRESFQEHYTRIEAALAARENAQAALD